MTQEPYFYYEGAGFRQNNNGSWSDPTVCADYGTAMACIILQIPNNYLPIMQK